MSLSLPPVAVAVRAVMLAWYRTVASVWLQWAWPRRLLQFSLCFDDESVNSVSPFSSSRTTSPTVTVFFSAFVSRGLWTPCVSCPVNRVNCFLSPQFDMILGKLENDGSRKVR